MNQIRKVAKRLGYSPDDVDEPFQEATVFMNLKRDWTPKQRRIESRAAPLEWWGEERELYPILHRIARRIFTMPTSSATSERNWSAHKFIYSDRRIRLGLEEVNMLVSMYWDRMEKKTLPSVVFDPTTLREDEDDEVNQICYEVYDSDKDEQAVDLSSSDEENDTEDKETQATTNYVLDYTFDLLGE